MCNLVVYPLISRSTSYMLLLSSALLTELLLTVITSKCLCSVQLLWCCETTVERK